MSGAFKKSTNGEVDSRINRNGRPKKIDLLEKKTNRELKEKELLMLLRKIKPHVSEAIIQAARIMKNEEASHQNQLKAATVLLDNYRKLTLDLYDGDQEAEGTEVQENAPSFSLTLLEPQDEVKQG
jgi:hypothetical protein